MNEPNEKTRILAEFLFHHFGDELDMVITPANATDIAIALLGEYSARRQRLITDGHLASEISRLLAHNLRRSQFQ